MSEFAYSICGAAPMARKYQVDATVSNVGVPLMIDTAGQAGLNAGTTTSAADFVGMSVDTVTYSTTQGTGADSAEALCGVICQPDAVFKALMSGGATEGTALTPNVVTVADTTGLSIGMTSSVASPEMDEGVIWGYLGANAGQVRKIATTSTITATCLVPFDNDIAIGDSFITAPYWPFATTALQLTTNLYQADASIAVATGAEYVVLEMQLKDIGQEGTIKSMVYFMAQDHVLAGRPT